jgi:hypothetical protein
MMDQVVCDYERDQAHSSRVVVVAKNLTRVVARAPTKDLLSKLYDVMH